MIFRNANNTTAVLLSIVVIGSMGTAFAEQLYDTEQKQLSEYLNIRGDTVFVTEATAKTLIDRGYLIEQSQADLSPSKITTSYDLSERWSHIPQVTGNSGPGLIETVPWYGFDLPQYVKVGEEFDIHIPYTYVKYDTNESDNKDDWEIDEIIEPGGTVIYDHVGTVLVLNYPDSFVWLNPDYDFFEEYHNYEWAKSTFAVSKDILYDDKGPQNIHLRFLLNGTVSHSPFNSFDLRMGQMPGKEFYLNPVDDDIYEISIEEVFPNLGPGSEPQPVCPGCLGPTEHMEVRDTPRNPDWPDMEALAWDFENLDQDWTFNGDFEDLEDYIRNAFSEEWAKEFLERYPQFIGKFILSMTNMGVPEAYAQPSYYILQGDVKIEEKPGQYVNPSVMLEVCIEDKNLSKTNTYTQMTKLGGGDACDELDNGRFLIVTSNTDPDGDGTSPDFVVVTKLQNEDVELKESKNGRLTFHRSGSMDNPTQQSVVFRGTDT